MGFRTIRHCSCNRFTTNSGWLSKCILQLQFCKELTQYLLERSKLYKILTSTSTDFLITFVIKNCSKLVKTQLDSSAKQRTLTQTLCSLEIIEKPLRSTTPLYYYIFPMKFLTATGELSIFQKDTAYQYEANHVSRETGLPPRKCTAVHGDNTSNICDEDL